MRRLQRCCPPGILAAEQEYLISHPNFEMPYGRAWFLRLAVERGRSERNPRIDAMAAQVAQSLVNYLTGRRIDIESQEYDNVSWVLLNLLNYSRHYHDERIKGFVERVVRQNYLSVTQACPFGREKTEWSGFMAVCTNAAWLVAETVPREEFDAWIAKFLPPTLALDPVTDPVSDHQFGLDFSRSWGFWRLYWITKDKRYLDAFLAHFDENMEHRDWWAGAYWRVGHWVAQFGMLAIALSFDDLP